MAFVSEYASKEDVDKYQLESVWRKVYWEAPLTYVWTVDRERQAFLIKYRTGREEFADILDFVFCWDGEIYLASLRQINRFHTDKDAETLWKKIGIEYGNASKHSRQEVEDILKEALCAYKVHGFADTLEFHQARFDF